MARQQVQHALAVFGTVAPNDLAEHDFVACVVHAGVEPELPGLGTPGPADGPAGQRARDVDDVLLRVAPVDAECVELQQLARVVLVDAGRDVLADLLHHLGRDVGPLLSTGPASARALQPLEIGPGLRGESRIGAAHVVEIEQHRRALRRSTQQIAEAAQHMRTDRVALVRREVHPRDAPVGKDVEVVEPEIDQYFLQLPLAVDGPQQLLGNQFLEEDLLLPKSRPTFGRSFTRRLGARRRLRLTAALLAQLQERLQILLRNLLRRHAQGRHACQPGVDGAIGDAAGLKLLVDPRRQANPAHAVDIARARPEPEAVEGVHDRRFVGQRRHRPAARQRALSGKRERGHNRGGAGQASEKPAGSCHCRPSTLDHSGMREVECRVSPDRIVAKHP